MKKLLLSAVVLSSIGLNAQSKAPAVKTEKAVGIETTEPRATLDVNGDARLRKVELMTTSTPTEKIFTDCPCVLTIDEWGVIHRIPKVKFVLAGESSGSTGSGSSQGGGNTSGGSGSGSGATTEYKKEKTVTITQKWTDTTCPNGKVGKEQTISASGTGTGKSTVSEDEALERATTMATAKAKEELRKKIQQLDNADTTCKYKVGPGQVAVCSESSGLLIAKIEPIQLVGNQYAHVTGPYLGYNSRQENCVGPTNQTGVDAIHPVGTLRVFRTTSGVITAYECKPDRYFDDDPESSYGWWYKLDVVRCDE